MRSFTDIFVRRPVLASVVSLLILLGGLQAFYKLQIRQFPELSSTTITITTIYPGANADLIKGFITTPLEQAVASTEGIDTLVSTSQQNQSRHHPQPPPQRQPGPRRRRRPVQDQPGQKRAAARGAGPDGRQADRPGLRASLHVLQFEGADRLADYRLPDPRRAAPPADDRRRRQRANPRRPDLRDAHLARPEPDGGARHHAPRRARRTGGEQLHLRRRSDQRRLGPDQHQRADVARKRQGLLATGRLDARRYADPHRRHRRQSISGRRASTPPPFSTG